MRNILAIIPFVVDDSGRLAHEQALNRAAGDDTTVQVIGLENGPSPADFSPQEGFTHATAEIVDQVRRHQDRYDGMLISCFEDPGVEQARRVASIPVVGPCETALAVTSLLGGRFFVLSPDPGSEALYRKRAAAVGLAGRFGSFVYVDFDVECAGAGHAAPAATIAGAIAKARAENACDIAILGCTALAAVYPEILSRAGGCIIEPASAGIRLLELMIDLRSDPR